MLRQFSVCFYAAMLGMVLSMTGCSSPAKEVRWDTLSEAVSETESETEVSEVFVKQESEMDHRSIFVDICGAVQNPGVYELEEGARVFQVIELAGGLRPDADDTMINRAEEVCDGMKLRIYTKDEVSAFVKPEESIPEGDSVNNSLDSGKVNINTADLALLTSLSGIGSSRAADIIAYRAEHGEFQTIEDIMNVNGIKEGTFQKIQDKITTE